MLYIDFETRSYCNINQEGVYKYAKHPSTEVLMMAYALDDAEVALTLKKAEIKRIIRRHLKTTDLFCAHNATFERLILQYVLGIEIPPERFYCTKAQASANNLPNSLENCAWAIKATEQKMGVGLDLMKLFSIPNLDDTGRAWAYNNEKTHPTEWAQFKDYCVQDTITMRALSKHLRSLTAQELADFWVSERINDRGLLVDVAFAKQAAAYGGQEQVDVLEEIKKHTKGSVVRARGVHLTQYVYSHLPDEQKSMMHKYVDGDHKLTLDEDARRVLLESEEVSPYIRKLIELVNLAQAPSVSKYERMLKTADDWDERIRGVYQFSGASSTGRFSSKGVQMHNLPRICYDEKEAVALRGRVVGNREITPAKVKLPDGVNTTLKKMLRPTIYAPHGYVFVCGDWSQIEARITPWISQDGSVKDFQAEQKLELYGDTSRDVYCETASGILGREVLPHEPERQPYGKVPELSLGFGGGRGALQKMARNYGFSLADHEADEIVSRWRENNAWAKPFWHKTFQSAVSAIQRPGEIFKAGRMQFLYQDNYLDGTLWNLLPTGRLLCYPQVRLDVDEDMGVYELSALKANLKPKVKEKDWTRNNLWYGVLVENAVQGVAGDLLRQTLVRCEEAGLTTVGHTHDEILLEEHKKDAENKRHLLEQIMTKGFDWSVGIPLAVESWVGSRYRK